MSVTVSELRAYLEHQPPEAVIALAGEPFAALVGWTDAHRSTREDGTPVLLLAFENLGLQS